MSKTAILIVEDEGVVAADLALKLKQLGYDVAGTAESGEEAVALAMKLHPDLVLMDIWLKGPMDGIEAAETIRRGHDVPVIYLTAHSDPATLARAKVTGPFGYILKPFEQRELATQVEMALYRHQTDRELRQQREWFRVTLSSIGDAVIATDVEGRLTFLNPIAESLTGWMTEEALGLPVQSIFRVVNEQTGKPLEEPVTHVLSSGQAVALANHAALVGKNGQTVPIEDSAAPILDAASQMIGVVLVFHDVTEKRRSEEALAKAKDELEQRVAERTAELAQRAVQLRALTGELTLAEQRERSRLAKVLHDHLQQLLVAAKFRAAVLGRGGDELIKQAIKELEDLIDESIDVSRDLTAELSPPILHEAGLNAGLQWLARRMADKYGLFVDLEIEEDGRLPEQLKILLFDSVRELLFNTVKHAQTSSAAVNSRRVNGRLQITVSDPGVGFDPTTMLAAGVGGVGFGLFGIRERMELMGGALQIQSTPGQGSRFVLSVPVAPLAKIEPQSQGIPVLPEADLLSRHSDPGREIRIMLADDHAIVRQGMANLLGDEPDIEVVGEAADGQEAIEMAAKLLPDVILMDMSMPKLNGVEATRIIHNDWPEIRIIGLSMFEEADRAQAMRDAGAVDYITKSGPAEALINSIRTSVRGSNKGVSGKSSS